MLVITRYLLFNYCIDQLQHMAMDISQDELSAMMMNKLNLENGHKNDEGDVAMLAPDILDGKQNLFIRVNC